MRNSGVCHSSSFKTGHYHSPRSTESFKLNVARVMVSGEEAQPLVPSPAGGRAGRCEGSPEPPRCPGPRQVASCWSWAPASSACVLLKTRLRKRRPAEASDPQWGQLMGTFVSLAESGDRPQSVPSGQQVQGILETVP